MARDYTMWQWGNARKQEMSAPKELRSQKKRNLVSSQPLMETSLPLSSAGGLGKTEIPSGDFCTCGLNDATTIMPHFPL